MSAPTQRRRWLQRLGIAAALACAAFVVATGILVVAGLTETIEHADVALVLGNKVEPSGAPSARLQARLDRAAELYRAGHFSHVITSGGLGREGHDEAVVMKKYLAARGIPEEQIIVDRGGLDTFASAKNTAQIASEHQWQSVLVISQYFHLPRSRLALRRCGVPVVYSAFPRFFERRDFYSAPRELVAYFYYAVRSYD